MASKEGVLTTVLPGPTGSLESWAHCPGVAGKPRARVPSTYTPRYLLKRSEDICPGQVWGTQSRTAHRKPKCRNRRKMNE